MEVAVAGGTGFIGRHLCAELVDQGHTVTAIARAPEETTLPAGVRAVAANVATDAGLPEALEGAGAVVNLVALSPLYQPRGGEGRHQEVHLSGTRNLVRAAAAADVPRFVQMSGLGADPSAPTHYLRAKGRAEGVVEGSGRDWVVLRPAVVFGEGAELLDFIGRLTTPYVTGLPGGGRTPFQPIWVEDIVTLIANAATEATHSGERYRIGGPEVLTLADLTRIFYEARGQSVRILPIPMPLARIGLTVAGPLPLIPFGPDQYHSLTLDHTVSENDVEKLGQAQADLRSFDDYLREAG